MGVVAAASPTSSVRSYSPPRPSAWPAMSAAEKAARCAPASPAFARKYAATPDQNLELVRS